MRLHALSGIGEITPQSDLAALIRKSLRQDGLTLQVGDVLVVAQKIISKNEGRLYRLSDVHPSQAALSLAAQVRKDPRFVELVLQESCEVVRAVPDILITRHKQGYVMANAGIDRSNLAPMASLASSPDLQSPDPESPDPESPDPDDQVLLLPVDCDASAARLRQSLAPEHPAVVISDSFGRPWREGVVNVALGVAGMAALRDQRGERDRHGRVMQTTQVAVADAIASAAGLLMGEGDEGRPIVLLRDLPRSWRVSSATIRARELESGQALIRAREQDLFR
jgi:coenzyme F420-0:L-glutamate ligase/coenzyme F420-1:gamma-L-glutamate ligase